MNDSHPHFFLTSPRLGFRCWRESDSELAKSLWGNAKVTELIGGPFRDEEISDRLGQEILNMETDGVQYWPIFLLDKISFVGCCGLCPFEDKNSAFELGFHLLPEYHGQGLASEAAAAVVEYAFTDLLAAELFAGHHPANHASQRVLEKLGFRYIGDVFYPPTGLNHPSYKLTREAHITSRK